MITPAVQAALAVARKAVNGAAVHSASDTVVFALSAEGLLAMTGVAAACATSGCGSADAFLDTSTQRTASWVQVRIEGTPANAAGWRWYCTPRCAAVALGRLGDVALRARLAGGITAALELLADADLDTVEELGRRRGLETARRIVSPNRPDDGEGRCYLCGCTENDACAGGCWWVPDPQMRDVCSACAPDGPCRTAGCGTTADNLDENDPELWGWIRLQVAGSEREPVWVCSARCAGQEMGRSGDELAAAERHAAADLVAADVAAEANGAVGDGGVL